MVSGETFCPFCGSADSIGYGLRDGAQRRLCKDCGRVFLASTGTVFSSSKLDPGRLRKLIAMIIDDTKLQTIMDVLSISSRTAYIWRMKIYKAAGEIAMASVLSGDVWIDEKLISVNERLIAAKPNGLRYAGCSRNQICVACAVDGSGRRFAQIAGRGHITSKRCVEVYGPHIAPKPHLIHDGVFSHDALVLFLEANDEVWKSTARGSKVAMQPINSFCSEISRNLVIHMGVRTENLQDYLNWIVFRDSITGENIGEKIDELVAVCFKNRVVYRVKDRYRL